MRSLVLLCVAFALSLLAESDTDGLRRQQSLWLTPSNAGRVGYINSFPISAPTVNETALTFSQLYYSVFSGAPEVVIPSAPTLLPPSQGLFTDLFLVRKQSDKSPTTRLSAESSNTHRLRSISSLAPGATTFCWT
jgi:hypothetical protein